MKVGTTKNISKPNDVAYVEVEVVYTEKRDGKVFALHRSYNPLFKCFMVSEFFTGYVLTSFSVQSTEDVDVECQTAIERMKTIVNELNLETLEATLKNVPQVNVQPEQEEDQEEPEAVDEE